MCNVVTYVFCFVKLKYSAEGDEKQGIGKVEKPIHNEGLIESSNIVIKLRQNKKLINVYLITWYTWGTNSFSCGFLISFISTTGAASRAIWIVVDVRRFCCIVRLRFHSFVALCLLISVQECFPFLKSGFSLLRSLLDPVNRFALQCDKIFTRRQ